MYEIAEANTGRTAGAASGNTSLALFFAGTPPTTGKSESWDGTSWTDAAELTNALYQIAGGVGGSSSDAVQFSGYNGSTGVANTEEWTVPTGAQSISGS